MIAYITVGTNDLERAAAFYDAVFARITIKRLMEMERGISWGRSWSEPAFCVMQPYDGQPATAGNGTMIALQCQSVEEVQSVHAQALALGGADEGAPGARGNGFYCAYFRDLDGHKLNAFCMLTGANAS